LKVVIETHGCKLNMADSQRLAREFAASGFEVSPDGESADVFVLNSCTVTHVADRKARHAISSARRQHPGALIVAAGCYPERDYASVSVLDGVDLVIPNSRKSEAVRLVAERAGVAFTPCSGGEDVSLGQVLLGRTRASVKIQEGCDQVCAYCIVPKVRGRERSVPVDDIVDQVNGLTEAGCREVILTGTQLGTYGFDLPGINLARLLRRVVDETNVPRIRVSSLQPLEITNDVLDAWGNSGGRLCPHFHIPLQSGSDRVLERMRRRYSADEFAVAVRRVRDAVPGCSVTTDIIAGFPGETADDHQVTLDLVEQVRFADSHVFPYSERPGTSAAHFDGKVDPQVRAERATELRELTAAQANEFRLANVGQERPVLWEGARGGAGLTDNYLRVRINDGRNSNGVEGSGDGLIEDVRLVSVGSDGVLMGEAM
jgi:threonylcarbamoyladenosine tRNA methylthiotransferase MtaB